MWPFGLYIVLVLLVVAGMLGVSAVLGQRHREPATGDPFESGIVGTGPEHVRLSIRFYLVAMFFVVFDLESIFVFAWAVAARPLGWAGYAEMVVFVVVLLLTLLYLVRTGALNWAEANDARQRPWSSAHGMANPASRATPGAV